MCQGNAGGTFSGDEEGYTAVTPCLCLMLWFCCPICILLHTFSEFTEDGNRKAGINP